MKKVIFLFLILLFFISIKGQSKDVEFHSKDEFSDKDNGITYVFGDKVKLRSEPNIKSEVLGVLRISDKVTFLSGGAYKTNNIIYNGMYWFWSEVEYNNITGYVLNGLLSQTTKKIGNTTYLTSLRKEKEQSYILLRTVNKGFKYSENKIEFSKWDSFSISVFDDRGVPNIENMIKINIRHSHDMSTTDHYYFNDDKITKKGIKLKHTEDGWSHMFLELITFPNDKEGEKGKIIYKLVRDEVDENFKDVIIKFIWEGKELKPKIKD